MTVRLDPATQYARDVASGAILAGPGVRDACQRHLDDLQHGPSRGLIWDLDAAKRACKFFPDVLRLSGGEHQGQPFVLLPWQQFIISSLFGWKNPDGYRRFRMAFVLTAKGQGKSPLSAGIGLYCLVADGEASAEVYAAASKRDQAMILFRDAVSMVKQSPALKQRLTLSGGPGNEWNIAHLTASSFFRVTSSEGGQSGTRPHCALLDEVHEHHDNTVIEMLRAGTKGRRQALIFAITNAEADRTGVCADYREYAAKVCSRAITDDAFFGYVCGLDPDDDPFLDEVCWIKANPSLGVTIQPEYLREQVTQARGMPSKEGIVRRLNFCQPTDAVDAWVEKHLWDACEVPDLDEEELASLPCFLGLDLSSKRDLTALAAVWKHSDGKLSARVWFWLPGDTIEEHARTDNVPYPAWRDAGHLNAPPGRIIDKQYIAQFVQEIQQTNQIEALAFDQAMIDDFLRGCDNIGLEAYIDGSKDNRSPSGLRMRRHGQGFAGYNSESTLWMPRSINELEARVVAQSINIQMNPVLRYNSASAVLQSDPSGNRKWEKRKATGRMDGMVALSMAVGAATSDATPSFDINDFLSNPVGF